MFRYAVVFEGNNLKRLLVEVYGLAFDKGVQRVSKNPLREVRGRLDVVFADEIYEIAETQVDGLN